MLLLSSVPFRRCFEYLYHKQKASLTLSQILTAGVTCTKDIDWKVKRRVNFRDITSRLPASVGPLSQITIVERRSHIQVGTLTTISTCSCRSVP